MLKYRMSFIRVCFLKVFGFRPFNPINKHYNPYLPCISQDTMYICFPYLC